MVHRGHIEKNKIYFIWHRKDKQKKDKALLSSNARKKERFIL